VARNIKAFRSEKIVLNPCESGMHSWGRFRQNKLEDIAARSMKYVSKRFENKIEIESS